MKGFQTHLADVRVDLADGGRALTGAHGGGGVEVGGVLTANTAAAESDYRYHIKRVKTQIFI